MLESMLLLFVIKLKGLLTSLNGTMIILQKIYQRNIQNQNTIKEF